MEEAAKLKSTRKKVTTPVPRAVSYWLFFKRYILEPPDVRARFANADADADDPPLDVVRFRKLVRTLANPAKLGPSFCRRGRGRSPRTVRRNTDDMLAVLWRYYEVLLHPAAPFYVAESERLGGLGLFARRSALVKPGERLFGGHLWGVLFELAGDVDDKLQSISYPSLYSARDGATCIMYGPLALVNHRCSAPLAFSHPRRVVAKPTRANVDALALEEFEGLPAIYARAVARCRIKKGDEITVDYFSTTRRNGQQVTVLGVRCRCARCAAIGAEKDSQ